MLESLPEFGGAGQSGKGGAKPFGIGRIAALDQHCEPHDISDHARGDYAGANLVTGIPGSTNIGAFLGDASPLGRELVKPHVRWK